MYIGKVCLQIVAVVLLESQMTAVGQLFESADEKRAPMMGHLAKAAKLPAARSPESR